MFTRLCSIVAVVMLSVPLSAQTGQEEVKSAAAIAALDKYGKSYAAISKEFKLRHIEMLKVLIDDLNPARADAIGVGDLDEALAIALKIKEAEKLMEQDQVVAVKTPEKPTATRFEIVAARWGAQDRWIDVTKDVVSRVKTGRLSINAGVGGAWGDPKFGVVKSFIVVYWHNNQIKVATYGDGQHVALPK